MTVREIAKKAGVSIGTVDRVIHGRGRVAPETRNCILSIIEESGYTPNPIARHLKLNKKYTLAVNYTIARRRFWLLANRLCRDAKSAKGVISIWCHYQTI